MFVFASIIILLLNPVISTPRLTDINDDSDKQQLLRAFDTTSYGTDEDLDDDDDMELGKIDIIKDGLWVIKAKLKELKAFNRALAANLKLTNMKLKELIENKIAIKKHQHNIPEKKNFFHKYQPQPYQPYEPQI